MVGPFSPFREEWALLQVRALFPRGLGRLFLIPLLA